MNRYGFTSNEKTARQINKERIPQAGDMWNFGPEYIKFITGDKIKLSGDGYVRTDNIWFDGYGWYEK